MRQLKLRFVLIALFALFSTVQSFAAQAPPAQTPAQTAPKPLFKFEEVMIPMRDGVRLQTAILTPIEQRSPLPILFRRTPYGVPEKAFEQMPASLKELAQDGYIFVFQNLRGRFESEGVFNLSSQVDLTDPKATTRPRTPTIPSSGW